VTLSRDPHHRRHAKPEGSGGKIGRRKCGPLPMVVDWCVGQDS
jgi:hypothetical protein